jgi:hypothetical protein
MVTVKSNYKRYRVGLFSGLIFISLMFSVPTLAQCGVYCVQITQVTANGQTFDPTQPLAVPVKTTLHLDSLEYVLTEDNAAALAAAHGRLDYAYSYAFPRIAGQIYETPDYIQVTPSGLVANPLQPGSGSMSLTAGDPWVIEEDWEHIIVLFLHYNSQSGNEEVVGRVDIVLDVQPGLDIPPLHSALWLWQEEFITNSEMRDPFLDEMALAGFDRIYVHAFGAVQGNLSALAEFIHAAADYNMAVEALAGDPLWSLTPYHDDALVFVNNIIAFTEDNLARSPVAIHFDVEPHVLDNWMDEPNSSSNHDIARQYLDLLQSTRNTLNSSSSNLQLNVDITFWYDVIVFPYNGITQSFTQHILDIVDGVSIMAYRDYTDSPNGVIALAENEVNWATAANRQVFVGLETNAGLEDFLTFCEEGSAELALARTAIDEVFYVNSAYQGTAIHDYVGFTNLDSCLNTDP